MITIRKASLKDVSNLGNLWQDFMKVHDAPIIKKRPKDKFQIIKEKNSKKNFEAHITKKIRSKNALVIVAEDNGFLVGYSISSIVHNIPVFKLKKLGEINDLYVKPKYQEQGISSKFKKRALTWFKSRKIKSISLRVWVDNPRVIKIYKKWGFEEFQLVLRKRL